MRHQKHKYKIGNGNAHRVALMKNLSISLIEHGQIKSTQAKCKALRPYVEKLVTIAKVDSVANRRLAYSKLNNKNAVTKLFSEVAPKYKETPGGYTRIMKLADGRVGDNARMSYIAFV
jgi:large subunit ribosomal protein L17